MQPKDQALDVWGDFACFTRPELKVERFSYPVPTPSAVRGIYDAIYCNRHEFRWQVTKVEILKTKEKRPDPIQYIALRRNEVKDKVSVRNVQGWMKGESPPEPIWADGSESRDKGRTQRQTMALRDVHYRLHAEIRPYKTKDKDFEPRLPGYENEFRRRASKGKCIYQPYLGCREFPAYFELVEVGAPPPQVEPFDLDIGLMLYDVFDLSTPHESLDTSRKGNPDGTLSISLFRAAVRNGILGVPPYESMDVIKVPRGGGDA